MDTLAIERTQEIPDGFLDDLRRREENRNKKSELRHVASIPVAVVEKWMREGFDIYRAPGKDIIKRLHAEGLDGFILR